MNFIEFKDVPIYFEGSPIPSVTMTIGRLWKSSRWILAVGSCDYCTIVETCNQYLFKKGIFAVTDRIAYPVVSETGVNFIKLNITKEDVS
jgi:hypothetical protein